MDVDGKPPVPAVPSVVLALGSSLRDNLAWLEQRFRSEIGSVYPGSLLRFRLVTRREQLAPEELHTLCDPLLVHPLWLSLQERDLAPGGEQGPQLNVYAILSEGDARGCALLAPLYTTLQQLYQGRLSPNLYLFWVGTRPESIPALPGATRPVLCFVLGPVKHLGYGISGSQEPFETIRLALNAMLASRIAGEIEALLGPDPAPGLTFFSLGASAITVARSQIETWLCNTLLQRLARACLHDYEAVSAQPNWQPEIRLQVAALFGLPKADAWEEEPDELWEKDLGRGIAALFPQWTNQVLPAWGIQVQAAHQGHWRVVANAEGDLCRRLQEILSEMADLRDDAQTALVQDVVRLASGLRRYFAHQERLILSRWMGTLVDATSRGQGCLGQLAGLVAATGAVLQRAHDALRSQRLKPLWLHSDRDIMALSEILAAQMMPVRSAIERTRQGFAPPLQVGARLAPFVLLLAVAARDLWPGGSGLAAGLGTGVAFAALAGGLQYRRLWRDRRAGMRELLRLYEDTVVSLALGEADVLLQHIREAVALSASQMQAVTEAVRTIDIEATQVLAELARFPHGDTYLERQLSDPVHCLRIAEEVPVEVLLGESLGDQAGDSPPVTPASILAAAVRGDLPTEALGVTLAEAVKSITARRGATLIETRVEELLVAGVDRPFSPEATMEGLHRRALPLWPAPDAGSPELALVALSREASMAFQGWLAEHADRVRLLPTLQRDRISYLRCRKLTITAGVDTQDERT